MKKLLALVFFLVLSSVVISEEVGRNRVLSAANGLLGKWFYDGGVKNQTVIFYADGTAYFAFKSIIGNLAGKGTYKDNGDGRLIVTLPQEWGLLGGKTIWSFKVSGDILTVNDGTEVCEYLRQ